MEHPALLKMAELAREPKAAENTVAYLAEHLSFLKLGERVLVCFAKNKPGCLGELLEQAISRCGAVPVMVEKDWRWKTLLWLSFSNRVSTVIAPPLVILGLMKLARYKGTPLSIRNVVTAGYPCLDWMADGIKKGLDCDTSGCFGPRGEGVVAGFSCGMSTGVHLRDDVYGVRITDNDGNELADGELGEMILFPKDASEICFPLGEKARIERAPCKCGRTSVRLIDMQPGDLTDQELDIVRQSLMNWTSVLDCRLTKGSYGLELELVIFPGEKLPKLPSCAKQVVRPWDPEKDEPFFYAPGM